MRAALLFALALLAPATTALAPVPGADPGVPCASGAALCVPWVNGNFDWTDASPSLGWSVNFAGTTVEDFDASGDHEVVFHGNNGGDIRMYKYLQQPPLPGHAKLEFDVEGRTGAANECAYHYDVRVILLGALDPLPFVDTIADLSPLLPLDYYNDEVLVWDGVARAGDHVVLDPLRAHVFNNPAANGYTDEEKIVWFAQHVLAIWVFYGYVTDAAGTYAGACGLDDFVRTLDA